MTIDATADQGTISVRLSGTEIARYRARSAGSKPGFDVLALPPSAGEPAGENLVLAAPHDHPWHLGTFFCQKLVDGVNCWESELLAAEGEPHGYAVPSEHQLDVGENEVRIEQDATWRTDGGEPLLEDRRQIRLRPDQAGAYLVEWDQTVEALGETRHLTSESQYGHYSGLSTRFARSLDGGRVLLPGGADPGETADPREADGPRARWCDYSGNLDGKRGGTGVVHPDKSDAWSAGIAMFDHPANDHHPVNWFIMTDPYGFLAANPTWKTTLTLGAGESKSWRWGLWVHDGTPTAATVEAAYDRFTDAGADQGTVNSQDGFASPAGLLSGTAMSDARSGSVKGATTDGGTGRLRSGFRSPKGLLSDFEKPDRTLSSDGGTTMKVGCFALIDPFETLDHQLERIARMGFEYADVTDNHPGGLLGREFGFSSTVSLDDNPADVRAQFEEFGLTPTAVSAHANLLDPTAPSTYGTAELMKAIRLADGMGVDHVVTTEGDPKTEWGEALGREEQLFTVAEKLHEPVRLAEALDVDILLEPHGQLTDPIDGMRALLDQLGHPDTVGVNLDTGNAWLGGSDPVEFAREFRDRIRHVHWKDLGEDWLDQRGEIYGCGMAGIPLGEGLIDIEGVFRVLEDAPAEYSTLEIAGDENLEKSYEYLQALGAD